MRFRSGGPAVVFGLILLILSVGGNNAAVQSSPASGKEALMEVDRAFYRATAERGLEGFASFLADDVWMLPDNSPMAKGKQAALETWEGLLNNPAYSIQWEPLRADVAVSGELGYTVGHYTLRGKNASGSPFRQEGKYITIWKKQPDGGWKVVLDGGNLDGPPVVEE